jgi:hypothetical protein
MYSIYTIKCNLHIDVNISENFTQSTHLSEAEIACGATLSMQKTLTLVCCFCSFLLHASAQGQQDDIKTSRCLLSKQNGAQIVYLPEWKTTLNLR